MAVAADLDLAAEHIDGALFVGGVERQRRAGVEMRVGEQGVPRGHHRRAQAVQRAGDHAQRQTVLAERRDVGCGSVGEGRRRLFVLHRQRHP